jgi:hypothetical protein
MHVSSSYDGDASELWAITSYFNPAGWRRRRANYRVFRERLSVPLVTVELAYGPDFELSEGDAEILLQLRGRDVMWQKERLLNVALKALPAHCRKVVWMDCDVIFGSSDWPETVSRQLDRFMIVQPFRSVHHLPPEWTELVPAAAAFTRESVASGIASGMSAAPMLNDICPNGSLPRTPGLTWAARRELLDKHDFYDLCIIGGGDRATAAAVYGCFDSVVNFHGMNSRQKERFLVWAEPFHETAGGAAGFVDGDIYHLWHGEILDRASVPRHGILTQFEFDPFVDIAIDGSGVWSWSTDKPQMHACVREYFASRREDG